jgi:hypothetical protein
MVAFSDSNLAGCPDDRHSTSGYYTFLGRNLLSGSLKNQPTGSRSSTGSEYKTLANAFAELTWIQALLSELVVTLPCIPTLYCDNIGATYLTSNPLYHARTKYIEINYHFVCDKVALHLLDVRFIFGKDQITNILTKPLVAHKFSTLKSNLNVNSPPLNLKGRIRSDNVEHNQTKIGDRL